MVAAQVERMLGEPNKGGDRGEAVFGSRGYSVIKVLRDLGVSFEEIAALGCHVEGEPGRRLTPEWIAVWFEGEKAEREPKERLEE
jgi:hypothetical protein